MVRPSSKKAAEQEKPQWNEEAEERTRLKSCAFSKRLLSQTPAKPYSSLNPSKVVCKHHGVDIVKKGQRKNKYLFSFPGLLAPVSGGKMGELKDLGSKNPILYIDFPQGRMKLLGTIVYPKNKYLTMQFGRTAKCVMCEDVFDSMIVFSEAWWIGKAEENPDELRLEFPKEVHEGKQSECDFKGGAGATFDEMPGVNKVRKKNVEPLSPESESKNDVVGIDSDLSSPKKINGETTLTPTRQSARTAGKKFKFAESSSEDDCTGSDANGESFEEEEDNGEAATLARTSTHIKTPCSSMPTDDSHVSDDEESENKTNLPPEIIKSSNLSKKTGVVLHSKKGKLLQATISTLFDKVEEKKKMSSVKSLFTQKGSARKGSTRINQNSESANGMKRKSEKADKGKQAVKKKRRGKVEDNDDIEDISSESQGTNDSDEDWAA